MGWDPQGPGATAEETARLHDRIDELENALWKIKRWSEAYPPRVFPEMTQADWIVAKETLEKAGVSLGRISADNLRHALEGVGKIAKEALE